MIELTFPTTRPVEAIDITDRLIDVVLPDGLVWLNCPHTTAALLIGESDPDMLDDYERIAREVYASFEPFKHHKNDNPNAAAHLVSSFVGTQRLVRVEGGRLVLGTYQRLLLLELDGPKSGRTVQVLPLVPGPTSTDGKPGAS